MAVLISSLIYPVFGHWAWGGTYAGAPGWLAQLKFVDFAGSTVVHGIGGWAALALILVIGPRSGRFSSDGKVHVFRGSNMPMAILGSLLLCMGWFGFNGGSTLAMNMQVSGIIANTMLAAVSGSVCMLVITQVLWRRPDVIFIINGALAGLVSITAGCHAVTAVGAVAIGSSVHW